MEEQKEKETHGRGTKHVKLRGEGRRETGGSIGRWARGEEKREGGSRGRITRRSGKTYL